MKKSLVIAGAAVAVLFAGAAAYRYFVFVQPLKSQLLAALKDPDSAQFRNISIASNWVPGKGDMCGEVNAKNALGGYVGYRWFIVGHGEVIIEDDEKKRLYDSIGMKRCTVPDDTPWWWITS